LFPMLLASPPGLVGAGGGVEDAEWEVTSANFRLTTTLLPSSFSGSGVSGWLNRIRRSEARSRYFGVSAFDAAFLDATFSRATSLRLGSL
jgi:hypothetical protein